MCLRFLYTLLTISIYFFFSGCGSFTSSTYNNPSEIISPSVLNWSLDDCKKIINQYTRSNYLDTSGDFIQSADLENDVFISAVPLLPKVIKAIAKKEAILKRLKTDEFFELLDEYLYIYTDYKYDRQFDRLIYTNPKADSSIGLSFQIKFENRTDPYHPIELNDGYEYFFLEKDTNNFSRIVEIGGRFSETDIYLADFLTVTVRFNSKNNRGMSIFKAGLYDDGFKLVFNALQAEPITLIWDVKEF